MYVCQYISNYWSCCRKIPGSLQVKYQQEQKYYKILAWEPNFA